MAVAAKVMPDYEGRLAYIDVPAEDPEADGILERFPAPYVPTSVFIAGDGGVIEEYVGALGDAELRAKLDALLATGAAGP